MSDKREYRIVLDDRDIHELSVALRRRYHEVCSMIQNNPHPAEDTLEAIKYHVEWLASMEESKLRLKKIFHQVWKTFPNFKK